MSHPIILWFRQDLRLKDNPALSAAAAEGQVIPVYILDETNTDKALGGASKWWLHHSLHALDKSLGGKLQVFRGDPSLLMPKLCQQFHVSSVHWNRCYEPWQIARDKGLKSELTSAGIQVHSHNANLLWEPWQVLKKDGTPYKVFTPYYRKGCLAQSAPRFPLSAPESLKLAEVGNHGQRVDELKLLPSIPWDSEFDRHWQPGEIGAAEKLSQFNQAAVAGYQDQRNIPSIVGTSRLSPHLHFGEISPNQAWYAAQQSSGLSIDNPNLDTFLSELGWREFSHYLLYHFPTLASTNFNPKFDRFPWREAEQDLTDWQRGQTGVPIVDAGLRELWQTGYMHNRVRMIVGSFLVKNLLLDWRKGEAWFWDCLLDADMAANSASWQWVAGSGADAAPYFRIFNPVTQGQKFDPEGEYVKRYCPELTKLPPKFIHNPWEAPANILQACNLVLGHSYPKPLVDLKTSRQRALDAFAQIKG